MPLNSFGAILSFAEELEIRKNVFYGAAMENTVHPEAVALFDTLTAEGKKQIQLIQRTRRENVTEMILEPIRDFFKKPFAIDTNLSDPQDWDTLLQTAKTNEATALTYYTEASIKLKALPEVARILKQLAKKQKARLEKLNRL